MPRTILALLASLAFLLPGTPAAACSSTTAYVAPSNFELVQMAEAIGIYTIADDNPPSGDGLMLSASFRLERPLKGAPPAQVAVFATDISDAPPPEMSDEIEPAFRFPSYGGGCARSGFNRGGRVLLILHHDGHGRWAPVHFGGSRSVEDYAGENSPWARTVRRYVALQRLRPAAQQAALAALRDGGRDRDGTPLLPQERADIVQHLRAPSQWKPTTWLLDRYARAARGDAVDVDLTGPIQWELQGDGRATLLTSLANGQHPGARPLFERLLEAPGSDGRDLGLALHYFSGNGQYQRAWRWIETRLANRLLTLDTRDAQILLGAVAAVQRGESYEPGHERWRRDPHVAVTWPELTLGLYWFEANRRRGREREFYDTAFEAIPVSDYRARPLLSVALAAIGNEQALAWANAELARLPVPSDAPGESNDEIWERDARDTAARLPLRMLVSKPEAARDGTLVRAFCQGGIRRRSVIEALRLWGDPYFHDLLGRMATFPALSPIERSRSLQAVMEMSARGLHNADEARALGDTDSQWLLTRLLRGQAREGPALTCPA